ncbi:hypothetical protein [Nocardioides sp. W7]|uniref:hypothetical protein n=1 Tax=Nocardioides sp. W7 TaxID=2931390 RepID=UPI001FD62929|nr:hypothetical protein [Nocardioides sp. W7]
MHTATPTVARLLGLLIAAGLVLTGLVVATPSSARAADLLYGAPAVGSCHDATFDQAKGNHLTVPTCRAAPTTPW